MVVDINKSLFVTVFALCVIALVPGYSQASSTSRLFPNKSADPVATSTTVAAPTVSVKSFTWSNRTLSAGSSLKVSKLVSSKAKGLRTYRATGVCSLRNNVLSFNRSGKCRVTVSVQPKKGSKVSRSSKVLNVKAKTSGSNWTIAGMPDPIGCIRTAKHPLSGTPYPDSLPGIYEIQLAWTCDYETVDARPLFEYLKERGWVPKYLTDGVIKAIMQKGSKQMIYGDQDDGMPKGQTLLVFSIYPNRNG
jgi:hypothetical protein